MERDFNSAASAHAEEFSPYRLSERPAKVVDALHQVVCQYFDDELSFYPLLDALHLLVPKSIAMTFFARTDTGQSLGYQYVFSTFPEEDSQNTFFSKYMNNGFTSLAEKMIDIPSYPKQDNLDSSFFVVISAIKGGSDGTIEPYAVCAASIDAENAQPADYTDEMQDVWLFKRLFKELMADSGQPFSSTVLRALNVNLARKLELVLDYIKRPGYSRIVFLSSSEVRAARDDRLSGLWLTSHDEFTHFIMPMLDEVFSSIKGSPLLDSPNFNRYPNLFFVFRYALPTRRAATFDYNARIILSDWQRRSISKWLDGMHENNEFRGYDHHPDMSLTAKKEIFGGFFNSNAEHVLTALGNPLGMNYRSISDTVFRSGLTDYSYEPTFSGGRSGLVQDPKGPDLNTDNEEPDRRRKNAENLILGQHGLNLFYVPIHVGGVPWAAMFTMNDDAGHVDARTWGFHYHLYRDLVPIICTHFRIAAKNWYFKALTRILKEELSIARSGETPGTTYSILNRRLVRLSAYFPYSLVQFQNTDPVQQPAISLPNGQALSFYFLENPHKCFREALPFDHLEHDEVQLVCERVVGDIKAYMLESSIIQATTWAHEISNMVNPPYTQLERALSTSDLHSDARARIELASQWLLIMGAAANVRDKIGRYQSKRIEGSNVAPPGRFFSGMPITTIQEVVDLVLQFHLASHARQISKRYDLIYKTGNRKVLSKKECVDSLRRIVDSHQVRATAKTSSRDLKVFYSDLVIWPLAFLRELVQNIKIANCIQGAESRTIQFAYRWVDPNDSVSVAVLETVQEQWERKRLFSLVNEKFPAGIRLANQVYGKDGACFGEILPIDFSQTLDTKTGNFRTRYKHNVHFFRTGGAS